MKKRMLLIALFFGLQCLSAVARTPATFLVENPERATVFSVDTLATPTNALMKLGECKWVFEPSADLSRLFENLARQRTTTAIPCQNLGRDANPDPNIYETADWKSCKINADDARPIAFAERVASSLHGFPCNALTMAPSDEAVEALATLDSGGNTYCYGFYWVPGVQAATVRLSADSLCPPAQHPVDATPGSFNLIADSGSGREIIFRFGTQDGQSWRLTSVETGGTPSAYLTHWANSIKKAAHNGLALPAEDPLHPERSEPRDAVFLSVRWALALALSSNADSDLENRLREWMGGIALLNHQIVSADIAYRSECDVASPPAGCSAP